MVDNLGCDIYLNWKINIQSVGGAIAEFLGVKFEKKSRSFNSPNFYIDLERNDSFDPEKDENIWDNFVFYKYILCLDPVENIFETDAAALTTQLLNFFWKNQINAVAACDYEHLLP